MSPRNTRSHARSLTGDRGARVAYRARGVRDEGDDNNHQESMIGGGATAPGENVGGAPSIVLDGAEFMQGVFTIIKQVVKNIVQTMQVPVRVVDYRATTVVKAFLQLRPPTFKGELDPLMAKDWLDAKEYDCGSILGQVHEFVEVYSTMGNATATIEETLNKTRKITNPKSQCKAASAQSEGHSFKKPKSSATQQHYPAGSSPAISIVSSGQTSRGGPICYGCHQFGHRVVDYPLKGQQRQSQQGEQSCGQA
ncbi:hypothetical protein Acr_13g0007240 [Actinidia rufa]|uniref:CCHC-type domain-containing protein n=1 Tax=Actinidia rufa TaxID=165716 RepID=A0A7J0FL69_9ERIC|nr:hypothetical protein Acr_13g0007240 [Actinidia rufa]